MSRNASSAALDRKAYTVGWITVIKPEFVAARAMLDDVHPRPHIPSDPNQYATGRIEKHNVVIACSGEAGTNPANHCATHMMRSFPMIRIGLLSGIGGGVPSAKHDIRLGDVVVSRPGQGYGGVVWYDAARVTDDGFHLIGHLDRPPLVLRNAVTYMEAEKELGDTDFMDILSRTVSASPSSQVALSDNLYEPSNQNKLVVRPQRSAVNEPQIHYGLIASGSWLIKSSGSKRDDLLKKVKGDVLCFEMEAAGLMNNFPCLVVRGISDYCDSHKNDSWHRYASATAACYCKWLLKNINPDEVESTESVVNIAHSLKNSHRSNEHVNPKSNTKLSWTFHLMCGLCLCVVLSVGTWLQDHHLWLRAGPMETPTALVYEVLPLGTVSSYTDRPGLSNQVEEKLHIFHEDCDPPHVLAIYGLGGSGKTQLTLSYIQKHRSRYSAIFWINGHSETTALNSFKRIAEELEIPVPSEQTNGKIWDTKTVQGVLKAMRNAHFGKWLAVIDDADDLTWGIRNLVPKGKNGSVIITSRVKRANELFQRYSDGLEVYKMTDNEAITLLLSDQKKNAINKGEQMAAEKVVRMLDYFPLAIDLARAVIKNSRHQGEAIDRYLTELLNRQESTLRKADVKGLSTYEKTLANVWDVSISAVKSSNPTAMNLLVLLSLFDTDIVKDGFFRLASDFLHEMDKGEIELADWLWVLLEHDESWHDAAYDDAVHTLQTFCLVRPSIDHDPGISIHSLVRWRARAELEADEIYTWSNWAFILTYAASENLDDAPSELRRHITVLVKGVISLRSHLSGKSIDLLPQFLRRFGRVMSTGGWFADAEKLQLEAIEMDDEFGAVDKSLIMADLAETYLGQNRLEEAEKLYYEVIQRDRKEEGAEHPRTLTNMQNLVFLYAGRRQWKEAEELQLQVLEVVERIHEHDHRAVLIGRRQLAKIYRGQGRSNEAEKLQVENLQKTKTKFGLSGHETASNMGELAMIYMDLDRLEEAEELQLSALAMAKADERVHFTYLWHHEDMLGKIYFKQRRFTEAKMLKLQLLERRRTTLGTDEPATIRDMADLLSIYRELGQWDAAEKLQIEKLEIQKAKHGSTHPDVLISTAWLVWIYIAQDRWPEGTQLQIEVVEKCKALYGPQAPETLRTIQSLISIYQKQGQTKEASSLAREIGMCRNTGQS